MRRDPRNVVTDEIEINEYTANDETQPLRAVRSRDMHLSKLEMICMCLWSLSWAMYAIGSFPFVLKYLGQGVATYGFWLLLLTGVSFLLIKISYKKCKLAIRGVL
jgi:hypothetical protein